MKQIKKKSYLFLAALLFLLQLSISMPVYAANGKLSIALSTDSVTVGNTVTVTLRAVDNNGKSATADMVFTYNSEIFSFVSCNANSYTGGEGGKVSFNGSNVDVKLKALAQGATGIKVEGSNGKTKGSGEALDSMTAAGVVIQVGGGGTASTQSGDTSLSGLTLSAGELSPVFDSSVTAYSATVPYETTSIEVNAQTTDSNAQIESITGNTELQTGENTIIITVKAENGATAAYQITVTREAEAAQTGGNVEGTDSNEDTWQLTRLQQEYTKLDKKYQEEKSFSRKIIAVLIFIIVVLVIVCINLILFMKRKNEETDDYVFGESGGDKKRNKTLKDDRKKAYEDDDDDIDVNDDDDDMEIIDLNKI